MGATPAMNSSEIDLHAFMNFFLKVNLQMTKKVCLTLCKIAGKFFMLLLSPTGFFFKIDFFKNFFQERYQSVNGFGPNSKLLKFAKVATSKEDKNSFLNGWMLNSKLFQLQFYSINNPYRMYPKWRNHFKNTVEKVMSIMSEK